jgi:hypothetical protein
MLMQEGGLIMIELAKINWVAVNKTWQRIKGALRMAGIVFAIVVVYLATAIVTEHIVYESTVKYDESSVIERNKHLITLDHMRH